MYFTGCKGGSIEKAASDLYDLRAEGWGTPSVRRRLHEARAPRARLPGCAWNRQDPSAQAAGKLDLRFATHFGVWLFIFRIPLRF